MIMKMQIKDVQFTLYDDNTVGIDVIGERSVENVISVEDLQLVISNCLALEARVRGIVTSG